MLQVRREAATRAAPEDVAHSWASEFRACLTLSLPLILTNAIEMAMNITNVAMIGRINPDALAASTLAVTLYHVLLLFGLGVTASVSALIAREAGRPERDDRVVRRIVQQAFWAVLVMIGPLWFILWNADAIFAAAGQDPRITAQAVNYLRSLQWSVLPALAYLVLRSLFSALERPRWIVATGVMAVVLNAALNWMLINGHAGMPALGLTGSGLATVVSNIFMAATLGIVAAFHPAIRPLRITSGLLWPDWTGFGMLWRLGLPIGISLVLEVGMFAVATVMIGRFSAIALAAHAIAMQVAGLTFMVPLGVAQAVTVRIGRAAGAGDRDAVARAGWTALTLGVAVMAVAALFLIGIPRPIIGVFIDVGDPESASVRDLAVTLLWIAGLYQIADGAQVVLAGMLRGLHDTRVPMMISALGYWGVGIPLGAFLAFSMGWAAPGVWIGLTAGLFSVAVLLLWRWCNWLGLSRHPRDPMLTHVPS